MTANDNAVPGSPDFRARQLAASDPELFEHIVRLGAESAVQQVTDLAGPSLRKHLATALVNCAVPVASA